MRAIDVAGRDTGAVGSVCWGGRGEHLDKTVATESEGVGASVAIAFEEDVYRHFGRNNRRWPVRGMGAVDGNR